MFFHHNNLILNTVHAVCTIHAQLNLSTTAWSRWISTRPRLTSTLCFKSSWFTAPINSWPRIYLKQFWPTQRAPAINPFQSSCDFSGLFCSQRFSLFKTRGHIYHCSALWGLLRYKTSFKYLHWVGCKKLSSTRVWPWPVNCNCGTHNSILLSTILRAVSSFWEIISLSSCRTISKG